MGDSCNRNNYLGDRSSTRTFNTSASHHSKSSWSLGWSEPESTAGSRVSANKFANGSNQNAGNVLTDRPTTRLHAPPGGRSTIFATDQDLPAERVSANKFASGSNQNAGNVITDRSTTRLHAPPGGRSTIFATDDEVPSGRVSSNRFANGSNQNAGNVITDRPTTKLHAPPGGYTNNIFGSDDAPMERVSANRFASGSNQNAGNVITDRPTTRLHAPPGGKSSIFGTDDSQVERVSSNRFATGSNQNAGNVITNRPTTKLHAPPGGYTNNIFGASDSTVTSSFSRGPSQQSRFERSSSSSGSARDESFQAPIVDKTNIADQSRPSKVSSNVYACGSNQNCGNVLTDRPTTRVHAPPGGHSSIHFG